MVYYNICFWMEDVLMQANNIISCDMCEQERKDVP